MRLSLPPGDGSTLRLIRRWLALAGRVLSERALWLALVGGLVLVALAYQSPRSVLVDIGGNLDNLHTVGFHAPETSGEANFRWSTGQSELVFQGIGKPLAPLHVTLQLSSGRGEDAAPIAVQATVNGRPVEPLQVVGRSAPYVIAVDPAWIDASGDVRIGLSSPTFQSGNDKRVLGFLADFARADLPVGATLPSLTQLLYVAISAGLLYLLMRACWLTPWGAGWLAFGFLGASAGVIAVQRLLLTVYTGRLAVVLLLAVVVTVAFEPAVRRVVMWAGWQGERALPEWSWTALRALVAASLVLKVGGLMYPHSFIIDAEFHLKYITYWAEGRDFETYFGKSLALSVMPADEWGTARAFIPYSPFFFIVASPLAGLPVPLDVSVPAAAATFEALKVALVFMVALALGTAVRRDPQWAGRVAALGAGVYALTPATFLLQQFGNWPTQTSLWLMTAWAAVTCLFWERITRPWVWVMSTVALTLTLLAYTVTMVYVGVFVGLMVLVGWLSDGEGRKRWTALALSGIAAAALAVLIYYGRYIGDILTSTLPTFGQAVEEQGKLTTLRPSWGAFITDHLARAMQSYKLDLVYALGLAGALWVFTGKWRTRRAEEPVARRRPVYALVARLPVVGNGGGVAWQKVWLGAWLAQFLIWTLADFYLDQALKQFWVALPAIAVVGAMWLLSVRGWGRGSPAVRVFVWLVPVVLAWQSISLWVFRLMFHNR
jgi:hypothetical protein